MEHWVIPLYIISGIVMAIGAYLTIRYRPYCTLKSPEREIAMELHRKKLMDEAMSKDELERNKFYTRNTIIHLRWAGALVFAFLVHFFLLIVIIGIKPLLVKVLAGLLIFGNHGWLIGPRINGNHCINFFGLGGWSQSEQIKYLNDFKSLWSLIDPLDYKFQEFLLGIALLLNIGLDFWLAINNFNLN